MIIGYTDRDGSLDYNLILSKKRAEAIKRKLIQYGFNADRITLYYYGETKSLHKGDYTDELKKSDRKVEIKILKK
jgi:K(+)-stimulated pyrophosphate-energized sodium pump